MAKQPSNKPAAPKPNAGPAGSSQTFDPFQPPPDSRRRWQATPEMTKEIHRLGRQARVKKRVGAALVVATGLMAAIVYFLMYFDAETHANTFLRLPAGRNLGIEPQDMLAAMEGVYLTAGIIGAVIAVLGLLMLVWPITSSAIALVLFLTPQVIFVVLIGPNILRYAWIWPLLSLLGIVAGMMIAHSAKQDARR